jgi:hypothetical protein
LQQVDCKSLATTAVCSNNRRSRKVAERIASPEADWNHANEMKGSDAACREDFGGPERLNAENWVQQRFIC